MPGRDQDSIKQKRQEKREKVAFGESARQRVKQKERKIQKDDDSSICSRQRACFISCFHALTNTSCHLPYPFTRRGYVNRLATLLSLLLLLFMIGGGIVAVAAARSGVGVVAAGASAAAVARVVVLLLLLLLLLLLFGWCC